MRPKTNKKRQVYDAADLEAALKAIQNGMGLRVASRKFGIPKTTLHDRHKGNRMAGLIRFGPTPYLNDSEENKIVEWCLKLAKCGFPRKQNEILNAAQKFIKEDKRKTPFSNDKPGKTWYQLFLQRHPILVEQTSKKVSKTKMIITEEFVMKWFQELEGYLKSINCFNILDHPERVFNADEISFSVCPKYGKILEPKVKIGDKKGTLTVSLVFSAAGKFFPPMVIFPYKRIPAEVVKSLPNTWYLGKSESGYSQSKAFQNYIVNGVYKWIEENNLEKPIILFIDGHKSELTLELTEFCENNGIILYALPSSTTNIMLPADLSVIQRIRYEWRKNISTPISKTTFCHELQMILQKVDFTEPIKRGFKRCGLYPFDPYAVDYSKCKQNSWENSDSESTPELPEFELIVC